MSVSARARLSGLVIMASVGIGCANNHSVTGTSPPTSAGEQSETAATTSFASNVNRIVVTYNDETGEAPFISYAPMDRVIHSGASLMGWSYSEDGGARWTYGGKVAPPRGWAVLWGDPAIATSGAAYNVVFISNLAIPSSKFPAGGIHGYVYYGNGKSSYIGGACIARSTDGGRTFAAYQCVSNTAPVVDVPDATQGHFYDGGSMASNAAGEVFAAYNDIATELIDVYRSPGANGEFTMLPTPFPNMVAASHPRLRIGLDGTLYVAAQIVGSGGAYFIYLNRYANGAWGTPKLASDASELYPLIDLGTIVQGAELTLRTGPQFGYDVGVASAGGQDAVRMLYVRRDTTGHLYLDASACSADLGTCKRVPGWRFQGGGPGNTPVDTFNPDVVAWRGFIGLPPTWQASWGYHVDAQGSINVSRATLGYVNGTALLFPVDILRNTPVCSDTRGYWGDYDAMILAGFQGTATQWMRFATDSSAGCTRRWEFIAVTQHVQQSSYLY